METEKTGRLTLPRGGSVGPATEKPAGHEDMYLCVTFVVLLAWALYVGFRAVDWSAVKALLAVIF